MLAFDPGVASGYDIALTVVSLVYAVVLTGCGLTVALLPRLPFAGWIGGGLVGGGIAAMHYTGMAAFDVAGRIVWDPAIVATSIVFGVVLGAVAVSLALGRPSLLRQSLASVTLLLAICSHHFIGMGAVTIIPDPTIDVTTEALPTSVVAVAVTLASLIILLLAGAALAIDLRDRRHAASEAERLRSLANAAFEGLLVCRGDRVVSANDSFAVLVGTSASALIGSTLSTYLTSETTRLVLASNPDQPVEGELRRCDGVLLPVELIMRSIEHGSQAHYAVAVRDLRARQKAERQIQFLALHDGLTGLANRTCFNRRLEQEMQLARLRNGKLAVLCLDLDRFKEVNDLFGHAAGDKLLQDVARIVTGTLDETQMMARLGGDEFTILTSVEHVSAAGRLAERVIEALHGDDVDATGPTIGTSIGIAIFPNDTEDRAQLLNYADTALYRAKSEGRGTYRFFESRMGAEVRDRRLLEHDLRHAIARGQIEIVYQPQTSVGTGTIVGFEALLRWNHPERGYVSPTIFIPIAEESGLILQLGEWVLRGSCREAARWSNPLSIAVNVSAVQLHGSHFAQLLHEVLHESGLAAERLEIEITESALIRDPVRALSTLQQVKRLGVRIAMDDFGTGYSSLSNLRQFPFDKIKIDGSFIKSVNSNQQTAAIVRSVLGLGRGLGLPVLAEGVETAQELDFLRGENCHEAQGFLMGRPAPIESFAAFTGDFDELDVPSAEAA
jgi:diguanylate cyclase (GGDEF)-like protein/PAS domain S-box-containing protein